jgi:hypothetical protein
LSGHGIGLRVTQRDGIDPRSQRRDLRRPAVLNLSTSTLNGGRSGWRMRRYVSSKSFC